MAEQADTPHQVFERYLDAITTQRWDELPAPDPMLTTRQRPAHSGILNRVVRCGGGLVSGSCSMQGLVHG